MRSEPLDESRLLPLVFSPQNPSERSLGGLMDWISGNRERVLERVRFAGGVLLRGFEIQGAEEFQRVVQAVRPQLRPYVEGQSQREPVHESVYTSTSYPAEKTITLHNELSYAADPPHYISFFCARPAVTGGETPIADCRRTLGCLPESVRQAFEGRGIRYVKNMHGGDGTVGFGKSWQAHFETGVQSEVERYLEQSGVQYQWLDDGGLRTSQIRPAISKHPITGEDIWFNQATLWHVSDLGRIGRQLLRLHGEEHLATHAYFDNGSPLDEDLLQSVRDTMWREATFFTWEQGDLLLLDNFLVAHGRNSFTGDRLVLVALS